LVCECSLNFFVDVLLQLDVNIAQNVWTNGGGSRRGIIEAGTLRSHGSQAEEKRGQQA